MSRIERSEMAAVITAALILIITALWWGFALWPVSANPGTLLARARFVCFGVSESGLPDATGWLLLIGQPLGMALTFLVVGGRTFWSGARKLAERRVGRLTFGSTGALSLVAVFLVGLRVSAAVSTGPIAASDTDQMIVTDEDVHPAPWFQLVSQTGDTLSTDAFHGSPTLVTFAFGHCETVCPTVVHDLRYVRAQLGARAPVLMVITLDPWRDVPSRLPAIAEKWEMEADEYFLSGEVTAVNAALDAWGISRSRDQTNGNIIHPRIIYLVDSTGLIRARTNGGPADVLALMRRLT